MLPVINQPLSQIAVVIGALYGLTKPAQYELGRFKISENYYVAGLGLHDVRIAFAYRQC